MVSEQRHFLPTQHARLLRMRKQNFSEGFVEVSKQELRHNIGHVVRNVTTTSQSLIMVMADLSIALSGTLRKSNPVNGIQ